MGGLVITLSLGIYAQSCEWISSASGNICQHSKVNLQAKEKKTSLLKVAGAKDGIFFKAFGKCFNELDSLFRNAIEYPGGYSNEKVYLHFDNTSYYLGEKLWFKAYVNSGRRQTEPLSTVLYVELLNQYGQQVERQVLKLENGMASGQFALNTFMLPGFYEVRAYTKWMCNFGELNYFSRVLPFYAEAVNGEYKRELYRFNMSSNWDMKTRPEQKSKKISLDFYPEGGRLVRGIPNVVAFRISTKEEPYPMASMTISSSEGDSIGECYTVHDGMGQFVYTPGEKPAVVSVSYEDATYRFKLPEAEQEGYCLSIGGQINDSILVFLRRSASLPADTLGLAFASSGDIYHTLPVVADKETLGYKIPLQGLPAGVAQALLFDRKGNMISERMFFVNRPETYVSIAVNADKKIYTPGEKVNLNIDMCYPDKRPVTTNFSMSVRDALSSDLSLLADNARTNLLLASELSGYIHRPEYYFQPNGKVRVGELDLLMLVQGWRKYDWKGILTHSQKPVFPLEKGILLEGRLKSLLTRKPQSNSLVSLMVKEDSTTASAITIQTDSMGHFVIPLEDFSGRCRAIFAANSNRSGKSRRFCYFLLDRNNEPPLRTYYSAELNPQWDLLSNASLSGLEQIREEEMKRLYGDNHLLDEVEVKARFRRRPIAIKEQKVLAYYEVENMVEEDWDKGIEYGSLKDFLRKKNYRAAPYTKGLDEEEASVSTSYISNSATENIYGSSSVFIIDGEFSSRFHNRQLYENTLNGIEGIKTLLYCEGSLLDDNFKNLMKGNMEMRMDIDDVSTGNLKAVSELRDRSYYGIYYITTTGEFDPEKKNRAAYGTRLTYINGYNRPQEFYHPDYSATPLPEGKDHRRTLYWNPSLRTDENGHCKVDFYNASNYTYLNVNAETITRQGEVGSVNMLTK